MDEMYITLRSARKNAIKAHNNEKRTHVIFKEMGLYRIKPVDEIETLEQRAIYGWTLPKWYCDTLHPDMEWPEVKKQFPMGDDAYIRKQFYKGECYYSPKHIGLKLRNEIPEAELYDLIRNGQDL